MFMLDQRTVTIFSPRSILIHNNWNRFCPDLQNFWKSSVWSSPDLPM